MGARSHSFAEREGRFGAHSADSAGKVKEIK